MGPCGLHRLKNGRESWSRNRGAWQLNSCSGNNGAVALATGGGLSLGLKAESGKRSPKERRLGKKDGVPVPVVRAIRPPQKGSRDPFCRKQGQNLCGPTHQSREEGQVRIVSPTQSEIFLSGQWTLHCRVCGGPFPDAHCSCSEAS